MDQESSSRTAFSRVQVKAIRRTGTAAVVEYAEQRPAPREITQQVLTSPFHVVTMPRGVEVIEFREIGGAATALPDGGRSAGYRPRSKLSPTNACLGRPGRTPAGARAAM